MLFLIFKEVAGGFVLFKIATTGQLNTFRDKTAGRCNVHWSSATCSALAKSKISIRLNRVPIIAKIYGNWASNLQKLFSCLWFDLLNSINYTIQDTSNMDNCYLVFCHIWRFRTCFGSYTRPWSLGSVTRTTLNHIFKIFVWRATNRVNH